MTVMNTPHPRSDAPPVTAVDAVRWRWRLLAARGDSGSSTVEMAVAAPLLVAVLLFVVLCGRLASAQLDVDAAAHGAARAASLSRSAVAAHAAADRTARDTLTGRGVGCGTPTVTVNTDGLRPGGVVTVTVTCRVPLSDLGLLVIPGSRVVTSTARSPIDVWRGQSNGFTNPERSARRNSSGGDS
jgi:Flp pilus assembly protein TadG